MLFRSNSLSELALTKLDVLDTLDTVKVCVAYDVDGERVTHLPYHQSDFHAAVPIYEELPGWHTDLSAITETHELPPAAEAYLAFLEEQVGVPVPAFPVLIVAGALVRDGQAVRDGHRLQGSERRAAAAWRLWLSERLRRGTDRARSARASDP